jgi:cytochrome P450
MYPFSLCVRRSYISVSAMVHSNLLSNARAATLSHTTFAFTLALSAFVSTAGLLAWHLYLVFSNQVQWLLRL